MPLTGMALELTHVAHLILLSFVYEVIQTNTPDRQTDRQTDRQRERERERESETEKETKRGSIIVGRIIP